jgi:hypothetical protein
VRPDGTCTLHHRVTGRGGRADARGADAVRPYTTSTAIAIPNPPLTHSVASPLFNPRRLSA